MGNNYKDLKVGIDVVFFKEVFVKVMDFKVAMIFFGGIYDMWICYWLVVGGMELGKDFFIIVVFFV